MPLAGPGYRRERPLKRLPQILCGFFIFLYALFFLYRAGAALFYAYPLEYGEGAVFHEAGQLLRDGFAPASLYPANEAMPYRAGIYAPLYYYLQALTMALTGSTSLLGGRLITLVASFYVAWRLYRVARATELVAGRKAGLGIGLAAALTPFATAALYDWGVLAKADLTAIALSMAAVSRVWRADSDRRATETGRAYLIAGGLCALALLTKQSALAAPIAILVWLGLSRNWRLAGLFVAAWLGPVAAVGLGFQLATGGTFLRHVLTYNGQPYDLGFLGAALNYLVWTHIVLIGLAGFWVARPLVGRFERFDLWRIYFLIALVVSFSAGKVGADFNYYLESLCLMSLLAWWQVGRLLAQRPLARFGPVRLGLAPLVLILMAVQLFQFHHIPLLADGANTPGPAQADEAQQVAATMREVAARGPLLAEDSGWQAALGLPVALDDPFVFGQLGSQGVWDERPFLVALSTGYFKGAMYEISQADLGEKALDEAVANGTAVPFERRFGPTTLQILQDRTKFIPLKRIGRYLFLVWKS